MKPYLALCSDRTAMPKTHPTSFTPEDWFANVVLREKNYIGVSFDFFIDWSATPNSLTPIVWIKRILSTQSTYQDVIDNLKNVVTNEFGEEYIARLTAFASNCHFKIQLLIFRDDYDWSSEASNVLVVSLDNNQEAVPFQPEIINVGELQNRIRQYSGGSVKIGAKGLIYGTSRLECFLSKTDSLYPGDADLILLDSENMPKAILEFKKHNLNTPVLEERLSKYYPSPDARKYNRLAILRDHISVKEKVPIIIIYYPTKPEFTIAKTELITGESGSLIAKASGKFELPTNNSVEQFKRAIEDVQKAIDFHVKL